MNKTNWYKIGIIALHFLRNTALVFPLAFAGISLKKGEFKYGFKFYELTTKSAIVIAAGFAVLLTFWNVLEFGKYRKINLKQYLKTSQKYRVLSGTKLSMEQIMGALNERLLKAKRWRLEKQDQDKVQLSYRFFNLFRDQVVIEQTNNGLLISSKPKSALVFMDLARNYKHIVNITGELVKANQKHES